MPGTGASKETAVLSSSKQKQDTMGGHGVAYEHAEETGEEKTSTRNRTDNSTKGRSVLFSGQHCTFIRESRMKVPFIPDRDKRRCTERKVQ